MTSPIPSNPNLAATFAQPVPGRPGDPADAAAARVMVARRILAMTRSTHLKMKPQIALVVRALLASGHRLEGGIASEDLTKPLPLKAGLTVDLLQGTFTGDPALAERIEQVVARYEKAAEALAAVEAGLANAILVEADLQELKLAAFFLSRFHEAVKDDPLLAQLFPPPQVLQADAGHAEELQMVGASPLLERAGRMLADLHPAATAAQIALAVLHDEPSRDGESRTALWATTNTERLMPLIGSIENTAHAYGELADAVQRATAGGDSQESWALLMDDLGRSMDALQGNPVLRDLIRTAIA